MIGQINGVYFRSYQLAHDFAKKAERCYRFELGNDDSFISYSYWDSMKKGLQSVDALIHDIKRMETGYLDKNKREYEITKHVSLAQIDSLALVRLRATDAVVSTKEISFFVNSNREHGLIERFRFDSEG